MSQIIFKDAERIAINSVCKIMTPFWKKSPKRTPREPPY